MAVKPLRIAILLNLQWPFKRHAAVFAGTQQYAQAQGWHSIIDEYVHRTLSAGRSAPPYDGIIARANSALVAIAERRRIPLVNVWASSPARLRVPGVYPDAAEAGRLCAEHLLARGFRSFATVTSAKNLNEELSVRAIEGVVRKAGFALSGLIVPQKPEQSLTSWRHTESLIDEWMDRWTPPIGLFIGQETIGRLVVQMCHARGWRVPQDVAIIAGQNQETLCEYPHPSLTSIEFGFERIGFEAARLLHGLMDGAVAPEPMLLPPQGLVVRESTDFFAVDDPLVASALVFISANSHRRIGPEDVARAVGAETRTLQNYFRRVLDRPVAAEIRRVRIERAKRELAQSQRPLAEIAHDVGFGDMQRLYEVFLREVGVPPSEYRKQRKLDERL